MGRQKGQLGLNIAERSRPNKASFDHRSTSLEQWVQALPVGNIGETARLVYQTLHEVNRFDIPWKERYRFLETLREPVDYVQKALVRRFTGLSFPLQEKTQRIAILARTLYDEMALGYKTAIEDMLGSNFLVRDNKILTALIHRAIRYLSQSMLICYQTYTPHPRDSWFELHTLYLHAEHKKLYQNAVRDEYNTRMPESSIARVYKQILLLALTSPYRLRQGEAEALYLALARWAGHAHIIPYNAPSASDALFVVHMDSDEAPDYRVFDHRDCNTELCRLVDTRQLSQVLATELEEIKEENDQSLISTQLMRQLIRTLGVTPRRSFSRSESDASIEVVVGSTMLHRALTRELADPRLHSRPSNYNSKEVFGISQESTDDVWDIFSSQKMKNTYAQYDSLTTKEERTASPPKLVTETWKIHNESAGGYRLALESSQQAKVQVGELLGLRHQSQDDNWEIGVVRWMRQSSDGDLEIGVQALAPQARAVMVKNEHSGGRAGDYQYALLLPEIPALKQPSSLITPIMLFQPGNELSLHLPGDAVKLKLTHKMQDTGHFVQFLFDSTSRSVQSAPPENKKQGETSRFGSVWDEL